MRPVWLIVSNVSKKPAGDRGCWFLNNDENHLPDYARMASHPQCHEELNSGTEMQSSSRLTIVSSMGYVVLSGKMHVDKHDTTFTIPASKLICSTLSLMWILLRCEEKCLVKVCNCSDIHKKELQLKFCSQIPGVCENLVTHTRKSRL
jgi:hypothetical protein